MTDDSLSLIVYSVGIEEWMSTDSDTGAKPGLLDGQLIDSIGQALHVQRAFLAGGQGIAILIRLAGNLDRRLDPSPAGSVTVRRSSPRLLWATAKLP